ncbi:MAG TPA: TetR/AcrR family transcriptional regulator [Caulobacteraceae bacterium]|nr:TetR/AcrR family transcriptional regulator [Caulobacteraceae bacterium]
MRYAEDHKRETRAKVLKAASRVIRQNGPDRVAVAGVMAEVGLTHGGFYAHFASKDDLLVQAIGQMFVEARQNFEHRVDKLPPAAALTTYFDFYLSTDHRDRRDWGCPLPALAADLPRLPPEPRNSYGKGVAGLTGLIAQRLRDAGKDSPEAMAASILSEMVGAVALARAVVDTEQSDRILKASREAIRSRAGF